MPTLPPAQSYAGSRIANTLATGKSLVIHHPITCQVRQFGLSNLVRNVPFVTSLEVSPFLFWFFLLFSSLAWPGA